MSKAIMVFDEMPDSCIDCVACYRKGEMSLGDYTYKQIYKCMFVKWNDETIDNYLPDILNTKPEWCPLRKCPEKQELYVNASNLYQCGWNDCIDEILRE